MMMDGGHGAGSSGGAAGGHYGGRTDEGDEDDQAEAVAEAAALALWNRLQTAQNIYTPLMCQASTSKSIVQAII